MVSAAAAANLIRHAIAAAGHVEYCIAVAPRPTIQRFAAELSSLGVRWEIVRSDPEAADIRISEIAAELGRHGFAELCVVSCDHHFAHLGRAARLIVIAPDRKPVARDLRAVATIIHRLPVPNPGLSW